MFRINAKKLLHFCNFTELNMHDLMKTNVRVIESGEKS